MLEKIALFFKGISDYMKSDLCLFKYFADALSITNNNIILLSPLILFIMFVSIYLLVSPSNVLWNLLFVLILFFAMTSAFFSGWFYTVALAVKGENDKNDIFSLLKQFPAGVGKHFISFFFMIIIFFLLLTLVIIFSYKTAYMLIGSIGISRPEFFLAMSSSEAMTEMIKSLTVEQQTKLLQWNFYFLFTTTVYSFLIMFWAPEVIFKKDTVINAFIGSLEKLFERFFKSLAVFAFLMLLYFLIICLSGFAGIPFAEFLVTVLYFYFLLYAAVLIFLFYKREFDIDE